MPSETPHRRIMCDFGLLIKRRTYVSMMSYVDVFCLRNAGWRVQSETSSLVFLGIFIFPSHKHELPQYGSVHHAYICAMVWYGRGWYIMVCVRYGNKHSQAAMPRPEAVNHSYAYYLLEVKNCTTLVPAVT